MSESLKDKTVKGVAWSGADNVIQFGVTFIVGIILARLLTPDDYGLLGIIAIFTAVCNSIIDSGFSSALIRKKEVSNDDYNTVFLTNMGMSFLLYVIIFFSSPLIASFFGRSELISLTRLASLGIIINGLSIVQQTRLTRKVDFKTQTKITLIASLTSGVVGIVMAFCGCGVWSLVAQSISSQAFKALFLWIFNKWLPKLRFSVVSFKELFGFGWKLLASGLLDTVWKELYQVIVGKFYSPATLGQYTRGKQFSQIFSSNLTSVVSRVTYPVLSSIQDEKERMKDAYRRIIKLTMFISAIGMLSMGAVAEPLLYCLIGPQWHEAATYLPLICLCGSTYPLQAINLNMLKVQGRSDVFLYLEIIKKIIVLGPLFVGAFVGIMPMLYANVITTIISFFLNSYYSGKFLNYTSWMQIHDIAPSYAIAFVIALSVYFIKYLPISPWIILPIQMLVGIALFFAICNLFKVNEYYELKNILKPYIEKVFKRV